MIIFSTICIISISFLSSCEKDNLPYKEEGYFKYYYNDNTAYVVGLTELGMQQEVLDFTAKIDGKEILLGYRYKLNYGTKKVFELSSDNLKKIYVKDIYRYIVMGASLMNQCQEKIIILDTFYLRYGTDNHKFYFNTNIELDSEENWNNSSEYHQFYANVEYNLNYDNNDIYFIDDYDNELISYIPQEPEREGYIFGGWYKESECINKWDFSNDIIKEKKWLNDNKEYYKDQDYEKTTLYAKWI